MNKKLNHSSQRIQDILHQHHLEIRVVEFKELTRTAQEAAQTIGCDVGQIAKTLIFKGKTSLQPICVITSGKNRVDEKKIVQYIGEEIEKPDAAYVLKQTGFTIGGVPPIGYSLNIKPFIDEDLMSYPEIWAAAGTPHSVFCICPIHLLRICGGKVTNVKK